MMSQETQLATAGFAGGGRGSQPRKVAAPQIWRSMRKQIPPGACRHLAFSPASPCQTAELQVRRSFPLMLLKPLCPL